MLLIKYFSSNRYSYDKNNYMFIYDDYYTYYYLKKTITLSKACVLGP